MRMFEMIITRSGSVNVVVKMSIAHDMICYHHIVFVWDMPHSLHCVYR